LWSAVQDWAQEPLTAAKDDLRPLSYHPMYQAVAVPSAWTQRLWLAGTEQSPNYGGYLEGALEAAEIAVSSLQRSLQDTFAHSAPLTHDVE
jgi:monoamine oxidase